jgi:hypothetical protein
MFPFPKGFTSVTTALAILGKGAITMAYNGLWILAAEVFPTGIRHAALGSAAFVGGFGGIASAYMGVPMVSKDF